MIIEIHLKVGNCKYILYYIVISSYADGKVDIPIIYRSCIVHKCNIVTIVR